MTLEARAHAIWVKQQDSLNYEEEIAIIASAIREAEAQAEQRAIDRCRQIISRAIAGDGADAESMRRLLLAAFDPRWDTVSSIINKD